MIINQKLLADLFKTNTKEINNFCKKQLAKKIQYRFLKRPERDSLVIKILQKILKDKQIINSPVRKKVWNNGWRETFNSYLKNKNSRSLIPKYYTNRENKIFRLGGEFIKVKYPLFEVYMYNLYKHWYFKKYFYKIKNIYEFGAGAGINLLELSKIFPKKNLYGSDFVKSSIDLLKLIATRKGINLRAYKFNMLKPNFKIKLLKNSGVFTCGSIEQLSGNIGKFINYIIVQKPEIIIHVEPTTYFYNIKKLPDFLGNLFQMKRGYSSNLLIYLKKLEMKKKIKILKNFRSPFGSIMMEGYDFIAWKPIK
jgi:hypothetical protein